jgi:hypothetical protein
LYSQEYDEEEGKEVQEKSGPVLSLKMVSWCGALAIWFPDGNN